MRSGSLRDVRSRAVGGDPGDHCKEQQQALYRSDEDARPVPAVSGIRNQGNTCFMSAVLQCLSNTDAFAEYLVSGRYRADLTSRKGRSGGSGGRVTEQLAQLLGLLWARRADGDASAKFKAVVERHGTQYQGSEQHDAQEFLMWLLDKVHEDLNAGDEVVVGMLPRKRLSLKGAKQGKSRGSLLASTVDGRKNGKKGATHGVNASSLRSDTAAQASRWQGSVVASLFGGQLRLRLTCPRCGRQSDTFDPFLCLSLPIPAPRQWLCRLSFVPRNAPPVKLGFHIELGATMEKVRQRVASECHVAEDQLVLLEETKSGYGVLFEGYESAGVVSHNARLVALELPPVKTTAAAPKDAQLLLLCRSRLGLSGPCLGTTRAVWVPREVSYEELRSRVAESLPSARRGSLKGQDLQSGFEVLVWDAQRTLPSDVDHPLFMDFVDCLLEASRDMAPAPLLLVILCWEPHVAERLFLAEDLLAEDGVGTPSEHESMPSVSLSDCLGFYFTEEKLEPDEAWLCPQCESRQQGVAQLCLWSCPEVLVVHLKRFHQSGGHHSKLATRVEVTQQNLDLGPHLCQGSSRNALYDLYALCSHHGAGLQGGHYTACCKNPVDGNWYLFDDARVRPASAEDLSARDAYLLFYKRQPTSSNARNITAGRGGTAEHWFTRTSLSSSRSHEQLLDRSPPAGSTKLRVAAGSPKLACSPVPAEASPVPAEASLVPAEASPAVTRSSAARQVALSLATETPSQDSGSSSHDDSFSKQSSMGDVDTSLDATPGAPKDIVWTVTSV